MEPEPTYENIGVNSFTQQTVNPTAAALGSDKLGKKPKPSPKPSYVAMKVAELNQRINSTSKPPVTKVGPTPPRYAVANKPPKSTENGSVRSVNVQAASDQRLYDTAQKVQLNMLQRISDKDVPESASPTPYATADTPATKTMPIYAKPNKRVKEEPIYDEAIAVESDADEDPLGPVYDEAIVVQSDPTSEPLYADPDDFLDDQSLAAASTTKYFMDQQSYLYEEAQPVNVLAIPQDEIYENTAQQDDFLACQSRTASTAKYSDQDSYLYEEAQPVNITAIEHDDIYENSQALGTTAY